MSSHSANYARNYRRNYSHVSRFDDRAPPTWVHRNSHPNISRGPSCHWSRARHSHQPYPSGEHILERAIDNLPFDEGFDDLCMRDLVWAHSVSADRRLEHSDYDAIPSFTGLLRRGLRDREPGEERNSVMEGAIRYAACVGAMSLSYCNKLSKRVPSLPRFCLIETLIERFSSWKESRLVLKNWKQELITWYVLLRLRCCNLLTHSS